MTLRAAGTPPPESAGGSPSHGPGPESQSWSRIGRSDDTRSVSVFTSRRAWSGRSSHSLAHEQTRSRYAYIQTSTPVHDVGIVAHDLPTARTDDAAAGYGLGQSRSAQRCRR